MDKNELENANHWPGENCHIVTRYDHHYKSVIAVFYRDPKEGSDFEGTLEYNRYIYNTKDYLLGAVGAVSGPITKNLRALSRPHFDL